MKALWVLGSATVHDIRSRLLLRRPLAYTTIMTIMDRLSRKGVVEREKRGRAHLYRPAVGEHLVRDHAVERLIDNFFRGSRDQLRHYLEAEGTREGGAVEPTAAGVTPSPAAAAEVAEPGMDPSLL